MRKSIFKALEFATSYYRFNNIKYVGTIEYPKLKHPAYQTAVLWICHHDRGSYIYTHNPASFHDTTIDNIPVMLHDYRTWDDLYAKKNG